MKRSKGKVKVIAHYLVLLLNNANGKDSWDFIKNDLPYNYNYFSAIDN